MATYAPAGKLPEIVEAFEKAKKASSKAEIVRLFNEFDLPREAVPAHWLNGLKARDALLPRIPVTAPVRTPGQDFGSWLGEAVQPGCGILLNLSSVRRLTGEQEGLNELSFAADDHAGKPLEPFPRWNFRLGGQPVSQQPKLIHSNLAALNARQQVRP